jgi:uncharacterized membrane protein (UPF0127 family)
MKNYLFIYFVFIIIASCQNKTQKTFNSSNLNKEIQFKNDLTVKIKDSLGDIISIFNTELADDDYKRQTGLMYRKNMDENQAMLFIFDNESPRYFYMKNTYIPLDIIYVDKNKKIVSWAENAIPLDETSLPSNYPAQYVLEIKGGLINKLGIKKGMKLDFKLSNQD